MLVNSTQVKVKEGITTFLVSTRAKCDQELSQPKHTAQSFPSRFHIYEKGGGGNRIVAGVISP